MSIHMNEISALLEKLYGPEDGVRASEHVAQLIADAPKKDLAESGRFSQSDVVLITYGDTLLGQGRPPLQVLSEFTRQYLKDCFSAIHFLPFFPYSSDDGFSVMDFLAVNPALGSWEDIAPFADDFDLMFDYVLNHISARSEWFSKYLAEEPGFEDLAIEVPRETDLSMVVRPRTLPLLTEFEKKTGRKILAWTTFSADQVDLNYKSVNVLCMMIDVLLTYVARGAKLIRMDAVAYLWKEIGTPCIHLPRTHDVIRLLRLVLNQVDPNVIIITETNVPHEENISYFGKGNDEAQMVYNFSLPPLLLHTLRTGDAGVLTQWARGLSTANDDTTFFNFTASHDGIGVRPLEGILPKEDIDALAALSLRNGGQVSYKRNSDGSDSPYELNVTYVDALDGDARKFLASQAIQLALPGVPAVYIHSLLGSRNWHAGVEKTGRARSINRAQLKLEHLTGEIENREGERGRIFYPYCHLLATRRVQPAFHPNAGFRLLATDRRVFCIERHDRRQRVFVLVNVSTETVTYPLAAEGVSGVLKDLISGTSHAPQAVVLEPYQYLWLEA